MKQIITNNFEETQQLGEEFASALKGGEVLALYGDLGSGKTTFMQGLAHGLGVRKSIISPTFIIMRTYAINRESLKNLYHVDLYRIENEDDVESLGLLELLNQPENVVAIEWPNKIENILPEKRINIYFEYGEGDIRQIRLD
jgi:tRNA threonylcarbamoyladenosine biosynthesis protein TsaE